MLGLMLQRRVKMKKKNSSTSEKRSDESALGENRIIPKMKNPIPMPKGVKPPKNSQGSPASSNKANSKG